MLYEMLAMKFMYLICSQLIELNAADMKEISTVDIV